MSTKVKKMLCPAVIIILLLGYPLSIHAAEADAYIVLDQTNQVIRGFGAASVWCGALSDAYMDTVYSTQGLSINRCRIAPNDNWKSGNYSVWADELSNAKKAIERGAIVFASPWTPPAYMKTSNNTVGGSLSTSYYAEYAQYLRTFADYFADNGAPLYAISLQNEPDWDPDYEGCTWTAEQFRTFLNNYGSIIASSTRIIMPESLNFNHSMSGPTLNDATASSYVSIIGGHLYGGGLEEYPLAVEKGKELWMTEHLLNDQSLTACLTTAKEIHDCMTVANFNAYIWWWIISDANGLYDKSGNIQKRGYVLGQFGKFIRNGYYRVDATYCPQADVYVSAYKGDGQAVIVAINRGSSGISQNFVISGGSIDTMSRYITSSTQDLAEDTASDVSGGSFWAWLPAQSVTTFIGDIEDSETIGVTGVTVSPAELTLTGDTTGQLTATVLPDDATNQAVDWHSSDTTVATVSTTGLVTGIANGTAEITVTTQDGGYSAVCSVTVTGVEEDGDDEGEDEDDTGQTCDSPVSVTLPLTINGTGEYCRVTSGDITYINSWNMALVEINGQDYTNTWSNQMPDRINGNYYIYCVGNYSWSHLEIGGSGGKSNDVVAATGVSVSPGSE